MLSKNDNQILSCDWLGFVWLIPFRLSLNSWKTILKTNLNGCSIPSLEPPVLFDLSYRHFYQGHEDTSVIIRGSFLKRKSQFTAGSQEIKIKLQSSLFHYYCDCTLHGWDFYSLQVLDFGCYLVRFYRRIDWNFRLLCVHLYFVSLELLDETGLLIRMSDVKKKELKKKKEDSSIKISMEFNKKETR